MTNARNVVFRDALGRFARNEKPDYDWRRNGMWETDDEYRRLQRAKRAIARGEQPPELISRILLQGGSKTYVGN